ncbi:MAG: endonuclease III [Deltaproteobacteria bacterium]|nr:MAG: endonuclease III [Deltaproteobacteria bacterium]
MKRGLSRNFVLQKACIVLGRRLRYSLRMTASKKQTAERVVAVLKVLSNHQGKTMLARLGSGQPYRTLVATVLSARVRDEMTERVLPQFFEKWPDPHSLARAKPAQVEKVIKTIGLYRSKSRRLVELAGILVDRYGGRVPDTMEQLVELPGVGRKTAGCVLVYAFGKRALPVDTHVHRISNRLGWVDTKTPGQTERELLKIVPTRWQAAVNDLLVHHGKTICRPIGPLCGECPVAGLCPSARS